MQVIELILALITLAIKFNSAKDKVKKELNDELNEAVSSHDLSKLNMLINKLRK